MYQRSVCPFLDKAIGELTPGKARKYLQWFLETKENDVKHLEEYIQKENPEIVLDKSLESLVKLWEWFESKIEREDRPLEDIEAEIKAGKKWMAENVARKDFTMLTKRLAYDISIYLGEVIIKYHPTIYWGVLTKPKSLYGLNWPRVMGFEINQSFWPYNIVMVCMYRSLKVKNKNELYESFIIWGNMAPKEITPKEEEK